MQTLGYQFSYSSAGQNVKRIKSEASEKLMEYVLLVTGLSTDMLKFFLISLSFLQRLIFSRDSNCQWSNHSKSTCKENFSIFLKIKTKKAKHICQNPTDTRQNHLKWLTKILTYKKAFSQVWPKNFKKMPSGIKSPLLLFHPKFPLYPLSHIVDFYQLHFTQIIFFHLAFNYF